MGDLASLGIAVRQTNNVEQRGRCPQCGTHDRDTALGFNVESGVYHCFRCNWAGRAGGEAGAPVRPVARIDDPAVAERKRERLRKTWSESLRLNHPKARAVCAYLDYRGLGEVLKNPPPPLRAHPALPYWDGSRCLGTFPAMIAMFNGADGTPATLHVTWLRADGCAKAPVPDPKKILGVPVRGATKGGSIRLYGPRDGVLGVAEGIENALSLHLLKGIPTWASFCADNLVRIQLPAGIRQLYIAVDIDDSGKGQAVAQDLADRVLSWKRQPDVYFVVPEGSAPRDLNDELRQKRAP